MSNYLIKKQAKKFIGITSDMLSMKGDPSNPDAIEHRYLDFNRNEKTTWKVFLSCVIGVVKDVKIIDKTFNDSSGKEKKLSQLEIHIQDDEVSVVQMDIRGNYAIDFLKKARNIDFSKEIYFGIYSFIPEGKSKEKKGVIIKQGHDPSYDKGKSKSWTKKIVSYYWDGEKASNGIPEPEGDVKTLKKDDWIIYFTTLGKFLKSTVGEFIQPMIQKENIIEDIGPEGTGPGIEEIESPTGDLPF